MCGIAFLYTLDGPSPANRQGMNTALIALRHRGPDDSRAVETGGALIGHRRLSIIDLEGSNQPMQDPSGRFTLSYNGEIYNFREVRQALLGRWDFRTDGDTELLMAGLLLEGVPFLERLEGMWAFVLWDAESRELLLARDRMGKKPLFFNNNATSFVVASELRALLAMRPSLSGEENQQTVADYFRYGFCMPGKTFYQGIHELLPGHTATWQPGKPLIMKPYWQPSSQPFRGTFNEACDQLRERFIAGVRRRLVADVEVGAFLSGGIDSSLIVAAIRHIHSGPLKTFTIGFADSGYDERAYARIVAERYATDHHEEVLGDFNSAELARLVLDHVGQPFADASLLPTAMVAALASKHVKVVLSGDGSDELFAGYQRYAGMLLSDWYRQTPQMLRQATEAVLRKIPEPRVHHSHSLIKKAHLFFDLIAAHDSEKVYVGPRILIDQELTSLLPGIEFTRSHITFPKSIFSDSVTQMMLVDQSFYLPQDILTKVDRATMAYSLEARAPFLDREVAELAQSLPLDFHMRGLKGKQLLRETFGDWIPQVIWKRRKHGFAVPLGSWFLGSLGDELIERLQHKNHTLSSDFVLDRVAAHRAKKRDYGQFLWAVYIYLLWRERQAERFNKDSSI